LILFFSAGFSNVNRPIVWNKKGIFGTMKHLFTLFMLFALGATELTAKPVAFRKSKKRKNRKVSNRKKRTLAKKTGKKPKSRGKSKGRALSQSQGSGSAPSSTSSHTSSSSLPTPASTSNQVQVQVQVFDNDAKSPQPDSSLRLETNRSPEAQIATAVSTDVPNDRPPAIDQTKIYWYDKVNGIYNHLQSLGVWDKYTTADGEHYYWHPVDEKLLQPKGISQKTQLLLSQFGGKFYEFLSSINYFVENTESPTHWRPSDIPQDMDRIWRSSQSTLARLKESYNKNKE
jgi:hypothetical protein